jgi:hypothetical protein
VDLEPSDRAALLAARPVPGARCQLSDVASRMGRPEPLGWGRL